MYTHVAPAGGLSSRVTALLADSWANRVAVRTARLDPKSYYDTTAPDYPPEMVPFRDDLRYRALDAATRQRLLAAAWVAYNEKTIGVETSIVAPACNLLAKGVFEGVSTGDIKRVIAQTQVDEQYHILMCLDACLLARKMHGIDNLQIPKSWVVHTLEQARESAVSKRHADIVLLGFACVAEVTINSYLNLLANDQHIQPYNRETTALHRRDESSHNKIFIIIAKYVYERLDVADRLVFKQALATGLDAFVKVDLGAWREILRFLDIVEGMEIIDTCAASSRSKRIVRDFSGFRSLLAEIDVKEIEIDFDFNFL